ncbi:MAG: EAL domain-containing protein [Negativicutes bacterium]|nr:EAL domain-containing protein [Negativicutes bacterium]
MWEFAFEILLISLVVLLLENVRRRRAAERELNVRNTELAALYEETLASEEELRQQFNELNITQEALYKSEERYKLALVGANDGLWDYDFLKDEFYLSERSAQMLNIPSDVLPMEKLRELIFYPEDRAGIVALVQKHLDGETPFFICEFRVKSAPGTWVLSRGKVLRNVGGRTIRLAGSHTDITAYKQTQEKIKFLAYHDDLTGLANRTALNDRAAKATRAAGDDCRGAIFFVDLDNFKNINDLYGHYFGDQILVQVAIRLAALENGRCFVGRSGGDEFIVLQENIRDRAEAEKFAAAMLERFEETLNFEGKAIHLTVSVGATLWPDDGATVDELFKHADMALHNAKSQGKNCYVFYNKEIDEQARNKMLMQSRLRSALDDNEFRLCYQPQIRVSDGRITGFEALLRWHSKDYGLVMPLDFIPLAEEAGLIVPIGRWVLKTACELVASLLQEGYDDLKFSVNLSVVELQRDFVEMVGKTVAEAGIKPANLALEITESVLMESIESKIASLAQVRSSGVSIFLDDFGTGYSSLSYLQDLPIDVVKIDKSFIDHMDDDRAEGNLTGAIIALAHEIGLKTVAEGVETEGQMEKLRQCGCDMVQGYLFSRPVPEDQVRRLLHGR